MSLSGVLQDMVKTTFQREFGADATQLFSAPGRVNLIGEHTDYNDGFVLPCAIQFETVLASRLVPDSNQIEIFAADYQQLHVIDLTETIQPVTTPRWANYVRGVVAGLQQRGLALPGCQLVVGGNVPQGAGLSSSASLEMVLGLGLSTLAGAPLSPRDNALNGQQAEHQFAGCQCGIMDQLVSAAGLAGQALLLDCRSLEYQTVPMPESLQVLIIHSNVKRGLVDSAYNERREQCEAAAKFFGVKALRDVTLEQLEAARSQLDTLIFARARHVISENNRTEAAAVALRNADIKTLSALMAQSHQSMRDDFAITVPAIDFLVAEVAAMCGERGGVRMTGGGFGGCVVALLPADLVEPVCQQLSKVYPAAHQLQPTLPVSGQRRGAGFMNALTDAQQLAPTALTPHAISCSGGLTVTVLPYGARVQSIKLHGQELTLSQADPQFYLTDSAALGASVGRYANRIANAAYQDSKGANWPLSASQPPHCLHGGVEGFAQRVWTVLEHGADSLLLELISPNGDQGFPGTLTVQQRLQVVDSIDSQGRQGGELQLSFTASTDAETVVNLTNHCYFNLAPQQTVEALAAHQLELMADQYLAVDECGIPLPNAVRPVSGHEFDFRQTKAVGPLCRQSTDLPHGLDHCFVMKPAKETLPLQARLSHGSGAAQRTLELRSTQPGVQVYVSTYLSKPFAPYQGICLEAQNFPDAPNRPDFPSAVLRPGELYQQQIFYRFS